MKKTKKIILNILRFAGGAAEDNISLYAAQASFFIIISVIPFIMLLLALLKFFVPINEADVFNMIGKHIPSSLTPWIHTIVDEIFSNSSNISIISVTAITTLWLASRGFMALYSGLNYVFDIKEMPNYIYCRLISVFYTVCFLIVLFLAIIMFGFGNKIQEFMMGRFNLLYKIISLVLSMRILIFLTLISLCFALFYTFLIRRKIGFVRQLPGAFLTAGGWMGFSYAYSIYIEYFSNYSYVYGSLTAIVFLMLWLYICMDIFLLGAEFNKMLENKRFK